MSLKTAHIAVRLARQPGVRRALLIVMFGLISFASINYAAVRWNRQLDLSYFKTTQPSSTTAALLSQLTQPLRVTLFFPPANSVGAQALRYLNTWPRLNPQVEIATNDHAYEPDLARRLKVTANGQIALQYGEQSEIFQIGVRERETTFAALRALDSHLQQLLRRLLRPAQVAYLTTGHLERDFAAAADDGRLGLTDFHAVLEAQGFRVKRLGLSDGLSLQVPADAALVVVAGPLQPFLPAERDALQRYWRAGGRLLLALDADTGSTEGALLKPWGMEITQALVAHATRRVRLANRRDSPFDLVTNAVAPHPSTATLARSAGRLSVILLGTGALKWLPADPDFAAFNPPPTTAPPYVTPIVWAMPDSFLDLDGSGSLDAEGEEAGALVLAAAIERAFDADKGRSAATMPVVGRAVVLADADALGDGVVTSPGNFYWLIDTLKWLSGDEFNRGEGPPEVVDAAIVQRRDRIAVLFYATSFLPAAMFLGTGLIMARRLGGKRRPRRQRNA